MPRGVDQIDEASIQGRLWQPTQMPASTLGVWYDADDLSTVTIATGVSQWRDKSGNGRHSAGSSTPANRPLYTQNAQNGRSVLTYSGFASGSSNFTFNLNACTIFVVGNMQAVNGYEAFFQLFSGGSVCLLRRAVTANALEFAGAPVMSGGAGFPVTDRCVVCSVQWEVGGAQTFFGNGRQLATATTGTRPGVSTTTTVFIGGNSNPLFGTVGEFMLIAGSINSKERQNIEGYNGWKWGSVSDLPASHPFVNRPPLIGD